MYMSSLDGWLSLQVSQISTKAYFIDDAGYLGSPTSLGVFLAMAKGENQTESVFTRTHICRHTQERQGSAIYAT